MLWLALGSLLVTSIAAIGAKSLREFSRRELEEICRRRNSDLRFSEILRLYDRVAVGLEGLHVATTVVFVTAVVGATSIYAESTPQNWPVYATASGIAMAALFVMKTWIPWAVARLWAAPFLFRTWRMWRMTSYILAPLVFAAQLVDTLIHRLAGRTPKNRDDEELFEDEIRTIVSEGHREGYLEEDEREMIEGIMELDDADVAKVMTPRTEMVMLSVDLPWDEMVKAIVKVGHTRIPVFNDTRDDVVGVFYVKDILPIVAQGDNHAKPTVRELMREPTFVPETKHLDDLLETFQKSRNHMAIVLDEYGGVAGLVTIEDVLEEIVGEIVDEHDPEVDEGIHAVDDSTVDALGRVHLDELNERFGLGLPDDGDFDTIGGFVFSQLGHVPKNGEELEWGELKMTVLKASRRRVEKVRLEFTPQPQRRRETA